MHGNQMFIECKPLPQRGSLSVVRLMAAGVLAVVVASATVPANAQGHTSPGEHGGAGLMMFGGAPWQVGRAVDRLLEGVNATETQRAQIKEIATAAAGDLRAQRDTDRGLREQALELFTAASVDASAADALRQRMSAQHDQTSKRALQAMLDIAKVLTPEQRARLGERLKAHETAMHNGARHARPDRLPQEPRPAPPK